MAGTLIQLRFKLAWQTYRVGDVITPNGTLRDWLLANGYAEPVSAAATRPLRLSARAAAKIAHSGKDLLGTS